MSMGLALVGTMTASPAVGKHPRVFGVHRRNCGYSQLLRRGAHRSTGYAVPPGVEGGAGDNQVRAGFGPRRSDVGQSLLSLLVEVVVAADDGGLYRPILSKKLLKEAGRANRPLSHLNWGVGLLLGAHTAEELVYKVDHSQLFGHRSPSLEIIPKLVALSNSSHLSHHPTVIPVQAGIHKLRSTTTVCHR